MFEQSVMRSLIAQVFSRIIRSHHLERDPEVVHAFLGCASTALAPADWQRACAQLLNCCLVALDTEAKARSEAARLHVERALKVIDERFRDVDLDLGEVATDVGMSAFYLSRLLKTHTGHGFVRHLHKRRVSAARMLLARSPLSVKEVATAVGYRSATQLGRQFRRICGHTPVSMRSLAAASLRSVKAATVPRSQKRSTLRKN